MRTIDAHFCVWLVLFLSTSSLVAQPGGYGTVGIKGATVLFMENLPPLASREIWSSFTASDEVIHRVLYDETRSLNFGYDLRLQPIENSTRFMIFVEPISASAMTGIQEELQQRGKTLAVSRDADRYPTPQVVEDGEAFSVEIAVNPRSGAKLSDLLMVSRDSLKIQRFAEDQFPARQFTIDDVHLTVSANEFLVNGSPVKGWGTVSGAILFLTAPDRGRYLLSFRPHAGYAFQRAGSILVNKMKFAVDGDEFEITSRKAILGDGGKWDLWVLHEPNYPTKGSGWLFGATGLESVKTTSR